MRLASSASASSRQMYLQASPKFSGSVLLLLWRKSFSWATYSLMSTGLLVSYENIVSMQRIMQSASSITTPSGFALHLLHGMEERRLAPLSALVGQSGMCLYQIAGLP